MLQVPTAEFLIEVGYSWAVYMKVTLKAAAAPSLAPSARTAKKAVPGVRKEQQMQQILNKTKKNASYYCVARIADCFN